MSTPAFDVYVAPVTPFQQNASLLRCRATGKGALVDPGGEIDRLLELAREKSVEIEKVFLSHGHIDHAGEAAVVRERLGIPIEGPHEADRFWLQQLGMQGTMFGFPALKPFEPDRYLNDGDRVRFGEVELEVIHAPGHTPGHVVFYHEGARLAFVGDVIFQGSIGRTDFPQGDFDTLIRSIREKLFPKGDDVQFIPGHGPTSTFGFEREHNPFCGDRAYARA
ncbi:MAG: MBL fold metallo-hydrolase [Sandaracinaceae bacterium]|nr:MBL fold metallo-hydrolase [Sandaracinaceae bacterium]